MQAKCFEVQGKDLNGQWSWYTVAGSVKDARYATVREAHDAIESLLDTCDFRIHELRIVEVFS